MDIQKGMIVKAVAGRDKERYFAVVGEENGAVLIADGKTRKLQKPKRKNIRHLKFTGKIIGLNDITNKKLKNVLAELNQHTVTDMGRY